MLHDFRKALLKPRLWRAMVLRMERDKEFARRAELTNDDLWLLVEQLLDEKCPRVVMERLKHQTRRALPYLLAALKDPRYHKESGEFLGRSMRPLHQVMELLRPLAPPEAVSALVPLVRHPDPEFRKEAAFLIGIIANDDCIGPAGHALADVDAYVRSYAMMGMLQAIDAGRASRKFLDAVFEHVVPLLDRSDETVSGHAPLCLLRIDSQRAVPILLDERRLAPGHPQLVVILERLNDQDVPIPVDRLLGLLENLRPVAGVYPGDYAYGATLVALGRAAHPGTERLACDALLWGTDKVRLSAAETLCIIRGARDPWGFVCRRLDAEGFGSLTPPQRHVFTANAMVNEYDNGGPEQYFFNSSGDRTAEAIAGLKEIGAERWAAMLQAMADLFGPQGPSSDRNTRQDQLSELLERDPKALDRVSNEHPRQAENVMVLTLLYASRHAEHFSD
jgi:hypothetical protein